MPNDSYFELKDYTDSVYAGKNVFSGESVLNILLKYGIHIRNKDGILHRVNVSIPKSKRNNIVVGLRYRKNNGTHTEDHFLFEEEKPIQKYYKGKIEKVLFEYEGTHKAQP